VIYLLHFSRPYRHAHHYLGFTDNLEQRLAEHRSGRGSPLVAAAVRAGIDVVVAATWSGDRNVERRLHRYKNSRGPGSVRSAGRSAAWAMPLRRGAAFAVTTAGS
jgi:hypothetical protein